MITFNDICINCIYKLRSHLKFFLPFNTNQADAKQKKPNHHSNATAKSNNFC